MKRLHMYIGILSVVVLLSVACIAPVAAQEWVGPETVDDAQELAEYQMHALDIQAAPGPGDGQIRDRNDVAQHQFEVSGNLGVPPTGYAQTVEAPSVTPDTETVPWYVEFNEINDCNKLARYQSKAMDINAIARRS